MKIRHRIRKYGRKWIKLAVIDWGWYYKESWKKWVSNDKMDQKATDLEKNGQNKSKINGNK